MHSLMGDFNPIGIWNSNLLEVNQFWGDKKLYNLVSLTSKESHYYHNIIFDIYNH